MSEGCGQGIAFPLRPRMWWRPIDTMTFVAVMNAFRFIKPFWLVISGFAQKPMLRYTKCDIQKQLPVRSPAHAQAPMISGTMARR